MGVLAPRPDDPDVIVWALSSAREQWQNGDHAGVVQWVKHAIEAAQRANMTERARELTHALATIHLQFGPASQPAPQAPVAPPPSAFFGAPARVPQRPATRPPPPPSRPAARTPPPPPAPIPQPPVPSAPQGPVVGIEPVSRMSATRPPTQRPPPPPSSPPIPIPTPIPTPRRSAPAAPSSLRLLTLPSLDALVPFALAALDGAVHACDLDPPAPVPGEIVQLLIRAPGLTEPVRLTGSLDGHVEGRRAALRLAPRDDFTRGILRGIAAKGRATSPPVAAPAPPSARAPTPPPPSAPAPAPASAPASVYASAIPRGPATGAPPPHVAAPLDEPAIGLAELFLALTAALARTGYYQRGHPESDRSVARLVRAAPTPLRGRGEISFARRTTADAAHIVIQTGIGESHEARSVLKVVGEDYPARLVECFERKRLVALTLREGVREDELADCVELLAGPPIEEEDMRAQLAQRGLEHVSALFESDLLGRRRKLSWHVDVCISRLARDLRVLPLLRDVDDAKLRALREQILTDVVRPLRELAHVRELLLNADLIRAQTEHVAELASLDVRALVVDALPLARCIRLADVLLRELGGAAPPGAPGADDAARVDLLRALAPRFVRAKTLESFEVMRGLGRRGLVTVADLPPELQREMQAERHADALARDAGRVLAEVEGERDIARLGAKLEAVERACGVLADRGSAEVLATVLARVARAAESAAGSDPRRASVLGAALRALRVERVLVAIARPVLADPKASWQAAAGVLVDAGVFGARALCAARGEIGVAPTQEARTRFRTAMRQVGAPAIAAVGEALDALGAPESSDPALVEDLLLALPELTDAAVGRQVSAFVAHPDANVRRAVVKVTPFVAGAGARAALVTATSDERDDVRVAAFAGLARIGAVDGEVVAIAGRVLGGGAKASDEVRAASAVALGDARAEVRAEAATVLRRALEPPKAGLLASVLRLGGSESGGLVVLAAAKALVAIEGRKARAAIEACAEKQEPGVRQRLMALVR